VRWAIDAVGAYSKSIAVTSRDTKDGSTVTAMMEAYHEDQRVACDALVFHSSSKREREERLRGDLVLGAVTLLRKYWLLREDTDVIGE